MSEIQAYDVRSFAKAYGISRAQIYIEIKAGRLHIFKVGRRTLISRDAAELWQRQHEQATATKRADARTGPDRIGTDLDDSPGAVSRESR